MTPDELADSVLREFIKIEHPQLFDHQVTVAKMEQELLKTLK